jgi:hypothetical protein
MRRNMKLYVWDDVLEDYTPGIMFALATSVEEARAMLLKSCDYIRQGDLDKEPTAYDLTTPTCRVIWGGS